MRRRSFIASCATGAVAGSLAPVLNTVRASEPPQDAAGRALAALRAARKVEATGAADRMRSTYHSDAIVVEPGTLTPIVGRAAIATVGRTAMTDRKLQYFYYRQPQVVVAGNAALVVSNYEAGYTVGGKTVEDSGKSSSVVLLGPAQPLIAEDMIVPNIYAGSYGARGTALTKPRFGIFPLRALGQPPLTAPRSAGGGENDVLFNLVRQINRAWVSGSAQQLLGYANRSGVFLFGDYSPYYIAGTTEIKEHFDDFYQTSHVNSITELDPTVKIWGDMAAVAFTFDLDYAINNVTRRSPGRAVYTFVRRGAINSRTWGMAACGTSHLVLSNIGDPYPLPSG